MGVAEQEEVEGALECELHNPAVGRFEGEDQGLEDEISIGESEAEQGRGRLVEAGVRSMAEVKGMVLSLSSANLQVETLWECIEEEKGKMIFFFLKQTKSK
ncbi:hypothetical protein ACJRO7_001307 [Eucalyptus globulus]|uniref:Uncharacterized protein n=1 Tax=Eucalyptus globulus TaxID=34317 RepID=A0ABD3LQL5_EUCGL